MKRIVCLIICIFFLIALIFFILKQFRKKRFKAYCSQIGKEGETEVYEKIRSVFSKRIHIVRNIRLPSGCQRSTEIDMIVFHPRRIFIIEVKNYQGFVYGKARQRTWYKYPGDGRCFPFYNPVMQNEGHIRAFKQVFPYIPDKKICSYIVFANRCTQLKVKVKRKQARVIQLYDLVPALFWDLLFQRSFLSQKEIRRMIQQL